MGYLRLLCAVPCPVLCGGGGGDTDTRGMVWYGMVAESTRA